MKIPDYASGKPVDISKPEEKLRQEYEQILVEDYAYLKEELDIEVKIPKGSGFFSDKADIVVCRPNSGREPTKDIFGIVETMRNQRKDGLGQVKSYMTETSAVWGVWANGNDIAYLCKRRGEASVFRKLLLLGIQLLSMAGPEQIKTFLKSFLGHDDGRLFMD